MDLKEHRPRVNASMLAKYQGKYVVLLGIGTGVSKNELEAEK